MVVDHHLAVHGDSGWGPRTLRHAGLGGGLDGWPCQLPPVRRVTIDAQSKSDAEPQPIAQPSPSPTPSEGAVTPSPSPTPSEGAATPTLPGTGSEAPAAGTPPPSLPSTSTADGRGQSGGGPLALLLVLLAVGAMGLVILSPASSRKRE